MAEVTKKLLEIKEKIENMTEEEFKEWYKEAHKYTRENGFIKDCEFIITDISKIKELLWVIKKKKQ